jgi:hypothetical protein
MASDAMVIEMTECAKAAFEAAGHALADALASIEANIEDGEVKSDDWNDMLRDLEDLSWNCFNRLNYYDGDDILAQDANTRERDEEYRRDCEEGARDDE